MWINISNPVAHELCSRWCRMCCERVTLVFSRCGRQNAPLAACCWKGQRSLGLSPSAGRVCRAPPSDRPSLTPPHHTQASTVEQTHPRESTQSVRKYQEETVNTTPSILISNQNAFAQLKGMHDLPSVINTKKNIKILLSKYWIYPQEY